MINAEQFVKRVGTQRISLFTLRNPNGMVAQITNYGAKIVSLDVANGRGEVKDVVLGFNTVDEWLTQETYFNACIGRYANRIKDGRFTLDGTTYQLPVNNGGNCLHGGLKGFNDVIWEVVGQTNYSVSLHYRAKNGEEGFPGNLDVYVSYVLTRDNSLQITWEAKTDAPTVVGFTNHAYFQLEGEGAGRVDNHTLQVLADHYTPMDETSCPTGEILPVEGTPMDMRQPVRVGDVIHHPFFAPGRGIDNGWLLRDNPDHQLQLCAVCEADGRRMEVLTTMPGLQVYTGNWVEQHVGKSGRTYDVQTAICLETQAIPNSPNCPNFPSTVLRPGEVLFEQTVYRFSAC